MNNARATRNKWLRKVPWLAALVLIATLAVWLSRDKRLSQKTYEPYSVLNTSPKGLSLARAYLENTRPPSSVRSLSRIIDHEILEPNAVVLRIGPQFPPTARLNNSEEDDAVSRISGAKPPSETFELLTRGEENWIRSGGTLVMAIERDYGPARVGALTGQTVSKTFPVWNGVREFKPPVLRTLSGSILERAHTLLSAGADTVACRVSMGDGQLVLLSIPEVLQNEFIAQGDHLKWLSAISPPGRPLYFDEYVHGIKSGLGSIELLTRWGFGSLLLLLALATLAIYWRNRTTLGPAEDDYRETRSEAVDFVDSLALLYGRALKRREAIKLYHKHFVQTASATTGLRGEELKKRLRDLLPGFSESALTGISDCSAADFQRMLHTLNEGFRRLEHGKHRRS